MAAEPNPTDSPIEARPPFAVVSKVLFPVALLLYVGFLVLPRDWHIGGRLVILRPWVPWVLLVAPVLCFVGLVVAAMASRVAFSGERPGRILGVLVVAFVLVVILHGLVHGHDWAPAVEARATDGETYFILRKEEFLVGSGEALGRLTSRSPFHQSFEVLGENPPHDMPNWAPVVRPVTPVSYATYRLVVTPDGELLLLAHGRQCHMHYDPKTGTFCGDGELDWISPFILIDETAELASADVDKIIESIRSDWEDDPGRPKRETLVKALEHPDPYVRDAAQKMLEAFDGAEDDDADEPL